MVGGGIVTKAALESAVAKRISDIAVRYANQARGEGREDLAKLWDFFAVNAIGHMSIESEAEGIGMVEKAETEVVKAADAFVSDGSHGNRRRLERAVLARREAQRAEPQS
jgi:hypothetical protein